MNVKRLQPDFNNDGLIADSELSRSERLTELDIKNEKADAQKHMAWVAMFSMIVFTIALFSPILSDSRVSALADLLAFLHCTGWCGRCLFWYDSMDE